MPDLNLSDTITVPLRTIPHDCWPQPGCSNPRAWAVFHSREEADKPFNPWTSIYIGVCSHHLLKALRYDPTAENIVRPYPTPEMAMRQAKENAAK